MTHHLMTADAFRKHMRRTFKGLSHEGIGEQLGLSAGFVGMLLSGAREPSRKVLHAMGFEKVTFYRASSGKDD